MLLTPSDAGQIALEFLMAEWNISEEDREWFAVVSSRSVNDSWYTVELAVEGYPDKWFIQVYDNGECDPNYTFVSPIHGSEGYSDLKEFPDMVASVLVAERNSR